MFYNFTRQRRVTVDTILLKISQILLGNPNGIRIILERKRFGMIPPIHHLRNVFVRQGMRDVTIIAG